jgi:hypothetical protein
VAAREDRPSRAEPIEVVATVLLSLAVVGTAWSSYQAARWNGEQAKTASKTNAVRIEASRAESESEAQTEIDVATFIQWVDATAADDQELADFYEARFRPEFQPAFEAWVETDPFTDPDAPPTPFAMDEYRLEAADEAARLDAEATALSAEVRTDIERATTYVLGVVMFAIVLFFGGLSTKLHGDSTRKAMLAVGTVVFVGAVIWTATRPISISFG